MDYFFVSAMSPALFFSSLGVQAVLYKSHYTTIYPHMHVSMYNSFPTELANDNAATAFDYMATHIHTHRRPVC